MSERKRDQRQYDLIQQYLPGLILNTILKIVNDLGDPYTARPSLGGMTAYPPRAMAAVCIVMEAERKTYRKMVGHLRNNRDTVAKIGLRKIPSKSTIARAYGLIPDRYLAEVHRRVICEISAGSVAGDSTGYSDSSFVRWYDVRTDSVKTKRGWVKLHSIIDIQTRVVLDYLVTASNVADIIGLRSMLARFEGGAGHFCLDSAYLARDVCSAISKMGMVPRIKPKSNTIHNAFGSQAWREMVPCPTGSGHVQVGVPPAQHHRGGVWRHQEDVRKPHALPQAGEPVQGDCNSDNLLQHRSRGQIEGKGRQAHTEDDRYHDCMTGAASTAPAQRSLRIMPWDGGDFMVSG